MPLAEAEDGRMRDRVRAGLAYIREKALLRWLLIAQGAAFVFFAAVIPIEVVYAKETLGVGDAGYGLMLASWGVGMVLGSLLFAAVRSASLALLLFLSTLAIGAGYVGLALAPTLALACAASVVGGAGNGVQWVSAISAVQELTVERMQARVMSVLESIGAAMPGVGFALGGLIAAVASPRLTFLVAGLGVFAIVAIMAPILGSKWPERLVPPGSTELDSGNDVVLELIPGSSRSAQSRPEVS
jgi:MFS family permease